MRYPCLGILGLALVCLSSCKQPSSITAAAVPSPEIRLQQIPPADPEKFASAHDMKRWGNPYLILQANGVTMFDAVNHEERLLKPEELPEALANLPSSAWPYGRVVAVTEAGVHSTGDDVSIRRNRGIVAGTLESLHIAISWVPSK